jgi:hypothetical protein
MWYLKGSEYLNGYWGCFLVRPMIDHLFKTVSLFWAGKTNRRFTNIHLYKKKVNELKKGKRNLKLN